MKPKKTTESDKAKETAYRGTINLPKNTKRIFQKDLLKHFIRTNFWLPRVSRLLRDRDDIKNISYLSLCAETALDVRLLKKNKLINILQEKPTPFAYCENEKERFAILKETFPSTCIGFPGSIEEISIGTDNKYYGKFWSTFPFDVINLDFWGDIHKTSHTTKNVFYAIQAIIFQQSLLRKPYEFWITERAKGARIQSNILQAYRELINANLNDNARFKKSFMSTYGNLTKPSELPIEKQVHLGFLKWLFYVADRSFSVIEDFEVLVYTRSDTEKNKYQLYNFLFRIKPYEEVTVPSPACTAATFCKEANAKRVLSCFEKPIDVDAKFKKLSDTDKKRLQEELGELEKEYQKEMSGFLGSGVIR